MSFLFFPEFVPEYFAWDTEPRCAQLFIGVMAGFHVLQDRRQPTDQPAPCGLPAEGR